MTAAMSKRLALAVLALALGCGGEPPVASTKAEVAETQVNVELPAVPGFEEPKGYPDGTHSVLEMRRRGKRFMDQNVKITGYVVWNYDCALTLGSKIAKETPERCDKPNFYLGDTPDTSQEKAIWVVDVPRPPRADEKRLLPKEELAAWPVVPVYAVGQKIIVAGQWAVRSTQGFVNSDGLLVYNLLTVIP